MKLERLTCRRRVALLCGELDGELSPALRRVLSAHRRGCLPCADLLRGLRRTVESLRSSMSATGPSAKARKRLSAALRRTL
ncbi:MAG: hypothetical protein HY923_00145 [Elusimicrobia bacterium]|nr:hypothetical protein [Elusimicrobiota bacterium]